MEGDDWEGMSGGCWRLPFISPPPTSAQPTAPVASPFLELPQISQYHFLSFSIPGASVSWGN